MNVASTADRSFEAQAFFCPWSGNAPGVSNGIAMRWGDDIIQLLKAENSNEYTEFVVNGKQVSWDELGDTASTWGRDVSGNGGLTTKFMFMQQMKTNRHNGQNKLPVCAGNGEDTLIEIGNHGNYNRFWQGVTIRTTQPGATGICSVPNGQMADNPTVQEEYRVDLKNSLFSARQIAHLCSVCNLEMHDHICGAPGIAAAPEDVCKTAGADYQEAAKQCGEKFKAGSGWFNVCVMETCASGEEASTISKIEEHLQELMDREEE